MRPIISLSLLLIILLGLLPGYAQEAAEQSLPGTYLGRQLYLTSLRNVIAEDAIRAENGTVPLYAQLWEYDADGNEDRGENILDDWVCPVDDPTLAYSQNLIEAPDDAAVCTSYDLTGTADLVYANRAYDLAIFQGYGREGVPYKLDGFPLVSGEIVEIQGQPFEVQSDTLTEVWLDSFQPVEDTYEHPYQTIEVITLTGNTDTVSIQRGDPVGREDGGLVGFVVNAAENQVMISPTSLWLDDLWAANEAIEAGTGTDALRTVLEIARVPDAVNGEPGIGDDFAPALGNTGIDVQHYRLNLQVEIAEDEPFLLSGTALLIIRATYDNLSAFTLDLRQMTATEVLFQDQVIEFDQRDSKLVITLPEPLDYGELFTLSVIYNGEIEPVRSPFLGGFPIGAVMADNPPRFAFVSEPDAADSWFPNNNHPLDAATYEFEITVDQPYEAIANGTLTGIEDNADGNRIFYWQMPDPMTTYLATLAVADYTIVDDVSRSGIPLQYIVYNDTSQQAMANLFSQTPFAMELLEGYFGEYPFDSYGQVITPMRGGALETQTMTAMPETLDPARSSDTYLFLIVHEMTHQWFGNAIRLAAWQDIWLNEGFATYAEWLLEEAVYGTEAAVEMRSESEAALRNTPRRTPLAYPRPIQLFSLDSYDKGAWVLHMLRVDLGDNLFFEVIREYATEFAGSVTSTNAFFQFVEQHTDRDLTSFREQWLEQPGIPTYTLYWVARGNLVDFRLCSERPDQRYFMDLWFEFQGDGDQSAYYGFYVPRDIEYPSDGSHDFGYEVSRVEHDPEEQILDNIQAKEVEELPECS